MINSINRRMTEFYSHPNNTNRLGWFAESFIGAFLLHPQSNARVMGIMAKFNQQLERPLTQLEQQSIFEKLERQLRNEL